jgi:hypothetical protein
VFSQEKDKSCALACAKMVVFKVNKLTPGAKALYQETAVEAKYLKHETSVADYTAFGAEANALTSTLNELGIGSWVCETPAEDDMSQSLIDAVHPDIVGLGPVINTALRKGPVILLIGWGHYVVVDTINKLPMYDQYWASVCDPWDGNVHITSFEKDKKFTYTGATVPGVDLWGDRFNYDTSPTGVATHLIRRA